MRHFVLTYEQLYADLCQAYIDARRHKRNKPYQLRFELRADEELRALCDELWTRTYRARPSICFMIHEPTKREVFAADFRDRIVHHLYFNYVHEMFERTFIQDTYSCIKGRGTHYGIRRLQQHIRKASCNYRLPCYVLKMDIRGYFMHINRSLLFKICRCTLDTMSRHKVNNTSSLRWCEKVDMQFVEYLTRQIALLNPIVDCRVCGDSAEWSSFPISKSLFHSADGCGLPIGNLTSQLFSNIYMNQFDQFMKRELKCAYYGRYVDDFYVVSTDKEWLRELVPLVRDYLEQNLGLTLHEGKLRICDVRFGVSYLGAYLKPWRNYLCNKSRRRLNGKLSKLTTIAMCQIKTACFDVETQKHLQASLNSFLGVLSHFKSYKIRERIIEQASCLKNFGYFSDNKRKYIISSN